ncbi:ABC transporter permease [Mesorhizobium sp. M0088]|uniref:ABC transporter permease n=1 Tax=Mesorhizobium sp. M0088 TaxID=2956873 RepID=UPI00333A9CCF
MTLDLEASSQERSAPGGRQNLVRSWVGASVSTASTVIVVLSGLLFVAFAVGRLLPIDPVLRVIGDHAPQALYDQTFRDLHLDRPLLEQFILFCRDMLRGDFGVSTTTGNLVADDIARFFPATLELATVAIIIGVGCGLPLGMVSARYAGKWPDQLTRAVSLFGHSVPIFWLGLVGLLVFYARLNWVGGPGRLDIAYQYTIADRTGMVLVDTALAGDWHAFANAVSHIALPGLLLGLVAVGDIARTTRGFLLWQLRQDYINVARLKGLSEAAILWRHAVPNALAPILAVIAFTYASLLEGAVLTETVFAWPGLGLYITQSLFAADMRAVLASTLIIGALFLLLNMLAEFAQSRLDPRARVR